MSPSSPLGCLSAPSEHFKAAFECCAPYNKFASARSDWGGGSRFFARQRCPACASRQSEERTAASQLVAAFSSVGACSKRTRKLRSLLNPAFRPSPFELNIIPKATFCRLHQVLMQKADRVRVVAVRARASACERPDLQQREHAGPAQIGGGVVALKPNQLPMRPESWRAG
eukprot:1047325-Pleurochrysis_carterae.AAC.1